MESDKLQFVLELFPWIALIAAISIGGWVYTTWLKIKSGYPLETSWGQPLHPATDSETAERIVTDQPHQLAREIEAVASDKGGNA